MMKVTTVVTIVVRALTERWQVGGSWEFGNVPCCESGAEYPGSSMYEHLKSHTIFKVYSLLYVYIVNNVYFVHGMCALYIFV